MAEEIKNVFISHIHEDDEGLAKIKDLLSKQGYVIRDGSINADKPNEAHNPEYIKAEILAPRIRWAGTFIVYISPQTHASEYVNWEIEYAHKLGKRIVGIWAWGDKDCPVPDALEKYADSVVPWNPDRIADALEGGSGDWLTAAGLPREARAIRRYSC